MVQTFKASLSQKTRLTADVWQFRFDLKEGQDIEFEAGQYLIIHVPTNGTEIARRLLSIITPQNNKNHFELLMKYLSGGVISEYFTNLDIGEEVEFQGPAGRFTLFPSQKDKILLAAGTGIAPIKSIILSQPNFKYHLFWGLKTLKDLYFLEEFKALSEKYPNFKFTICLSRENDLSQINKETQKFFQKGRVNEAFDNFILNTSYHILNSDYYLCGDRAVVESLKQYLLDKKISHDNIFFEKF